MVVVGTCVAKEKKEEKQCKDTEISAFEKDITTA
jgi:hypothetical protein